MNTFKLLRCISSVGLIALAAISTSAHALELGDSAPLVQWATDTGKLDLGSLKGQVVYVDFWASWCGPCRASFPWMNDMQAKYAAKGLKVVAVNLDANPADAKKFLAETPAQFQVTYDSKGETPRLFGVKGMPTSYLFDRQGKLVSVHTGFNAGQKDKLEKALTSMLEK